MQMTQHCLLPIQEPCLLQPVSRPVPLSIRTSRVWLTGDMTGSSLITKRRLTCCLLCPAQNHRFPTLSLDYSPLKELPGIRLLGWDKYISGVAKRASRCLGCLFCAQWYLPQTAMLYLYKVTIWPVMEYCCHIWAGVSPAKEGQMVSIHWFIYRLCRLQTSGMISSPKLESLNHLFRFCASYSTMDMLFLLIQEWMNARRMNN